MTHAIFALCFFLIGALVPARALADPPSCAPFSDAGCFFGENFENSTLSGWGVNAPANASVVSPGLNGTGKTAQLLYSGVDAGIWADASVTHAGTNGEVVWIEFRLKYSPEYIWAAGPAGVSGAKTFEFYLNGAGGCPGRVLLTIHQGSGGATTGTPVWSLYPNYGASCPGGSGQEEVHPLGGFTVTRGVEYHVIIEVKTASGANGYIKTWFNGVLTHSQSGIQTASNAALGWQYVRIGGQYGNAGAGSTARYDQIRITTTNLTPGTPPPPPPPVTVPNAPTNLRVE